MASDALEIYVHRLATEIWKAARSESEAGVVAASRASVQAEKELIRRLTDLEREAGRLRDALKPFADAFVPYPTDADAGFVAFLDANTVTPGMCMGDFRRASEAAATRQEATGAGGGGAP